MGPQVRPTYRLPDHLRAALAGSFGQVTDTQGLRVLLADDDVVAAVGDVVSMSLHEIGVKPRLFICDYKTQRGDDDPDFKRVLGSWGDREVRVQNPAATITPQAWGAVADAFHQDGTTRIVVDGEEDMLGIPAFLEAPLGAKVLYGKPGVGAVVVTIDAAFQAHVQGLVDQFDQE